MRDLNEVVNELGQLSDNDIAAYLKVHGITGVRGSTASCPLAEYISKETGLNVRVASYVWVPFNEGCPALSRGTKQEVMTPESMRAFISKFDAGKWPELMRETVE